ncbi:MAG: hypothetical protein NTZ09_18525 [Candidatus Hydrogenedentes bacterium]|nr:hypothetical protein [Candidatus Hydrogenedentota bacterium]
MARIGKPLLSAQNVVKGFGGQPVLRDVSLTIHEGDRVGLIGRRGCTSNASICCTGLAWTTRGIPPKPSNVSRRRWTSPRRNG